MLAETDLRDCGRAANAHNVMRQAEGGMMINVKGMRPVLLCLCLLISSNLNAEIVQIPLADLNGLYGRLDYNIPEWRTQSFSFENMPTRVDSAWIRVTGINMPGLYTCDGFSHPEPIPLEMWANVSDTVVGGFWYTYGVDIEMNGEFEVIIPFCSLQAIDFSAENALLAELNYNWGFVPPQLDCTIYEIATGFVEEVILYVEGEFEVPIEYDSWGRIKKLILEDSN